MSQSSIPEPAPVNASTPVANNLVIAIVATVLSLWCCLPHGIISLIFATQVNKKAQAGDIQGAIDSARKAKTWAWISIIVSLAWFVLSFILGVVGGVLSALSNH